MVLLVISDHHRQHPPLPRAGTAAERSTRFSNIIMPGTQSSHRPQDIPALGKTMMLHANTQLPYLCSRITSSHGKQSRTRHAGTWSDSAERSYARGPLVPTAHARACAFTHVCNAAPSQCHDLHHTDTICRKGKQQMANKPGARIPQTS